MILFNQYFLFYRQGFEFGATTGKIKSLNLNTSEVVTMKIRREPKTEEFLAGIHGITYWRDPRSGLKKDLISERIHENYIT